MPCAPRPQVPPATRLLGHPGRGRCHTRALASVVSVLVLLGPLVRLVRRWNPDGAHCWADTLSALSGHGVRSLSAPTVSAPLDL
ncbi:hypothetical protein GCM10010346_17000 [Streptomyces chryseus]|uniref:Uncharacterized protein n=1 Tax=Streptomyces chryseus TaxID=68186 RepID=A0ABQ3DHG4_9ACTN|nr:hypothetical protein GCM10010346_17000 [Streptomyces chryseus]